MSIRERIRRWTTTPDIPLLEENESLYFTAPAARYRIVNRTKHNLFTAGRLTLADRRLIYVATAIGSEDLRDLELPWHTVERAEVIHGFAKVWAAPKPYVMLPFLRHPMFRVYGANGQATMFRLYSSDGWQAVVHQLRMLHPQLDPLAG